MAWMARYRNPDDGKIYRIKVRPYPDGFFPTRRVAGIYGERYASRSGNPVFYNPISRPVPAPAINVRNLSPSKGSNSKKVVLLHSTESHDRPGTSDVSGILSYLKRKGLGVHYVIDGEGYLGQGAGHHQVVYHARGANSFSIGIEQIGFAKWSATRWLKWPNGTARKQLDRTAYLIAWICDKEGIPIRHSTSHGVALHRDFPAGGHWDPGYGYPLWWVLRRARLYRKQWRGTVYGYGGR